MLPEQSRTGSFQRRRTSPHRRHGRYVAIAACLVVAIPVALLLVSLLTPLGIRMRGHGIRAELRSNPFVSPHDPPGAPRELSGPISWSAESFRNSRGQQTRLWRWTKGDFFYEVVVW